ncbi:hypothetical protein FHT71_004119 [Rhizobium sp. BK060]|nr:hypothetical protein [Rhizobium sp. BK060]
MTTAPSIELPSCWRDALAHFRSEPPDPQSGLPFAQRRASLTALHIAKVHLVAQVIA